MQEPEDIQMYFYVDESGDPTILGRKGRNPTEIVIHVNMLKEGWDVTNLYTIVPLRAANSRTLVEQSIGRGFPPSSLRSSPAKRISRNWAMTSGVREVREYLPRCFTIILERFWSATCVVGRFEGTTSDR